ncbi:MAG: hypothetical protein ACTSW1_18645 [Candidatus Hodarchaeales archaeon]
MNYNENNNSNRKRELRGREKLIKFHKNEAIKNQYEEFIHKIQQEKMKELLENQEDEAWENV